MSNSAIPWTTALQASLSFTISWSLLKVMSIELMMLSNHLILCHPLLLLPSIFPSISMSQLFVSVGEIIGASASILPVNIQDWFPGLILCSLRDSQEPSPTPQLESISSSALSFIYGPIFTSLQDYRKNHNFDYTELCWQNDVSAFNMLSGVVIALLPRANIF